MKIQFYLPFIIIIFTFSTARAELGRFDNALDPVRTAEDALSEGKRKCVNLITPVTAILEDNDIQIENDVCFYTKHDHKIISKFFIKNLKQVLDIEILTRSTSVRQLMLYQNLTPTTLNATLLMTSSDLLTVQKCKATYNAKLVEESLNKMNAKIENNKYPKLIELMDSVFHQFRCL